MNRLLPIRRRPWHVTSELFFFASSSRNSACSCSRPIKVFMSIRCLNSRCFFGTLSPYQRFRAIILKRNSGTKATFRQYPKTSYRSIACIPQGHSDIVAVFRTALLNIVLRCHTKKLTQSGKDARCRAPSPHHRLTQTIIFATPATLEKSSSVT